MKTQTKAPLRRVLSLMLSLVLLISMAVAALPVSADDHVHIDLDKTYGTLIQANIKGVCDYKTAFQVLDIVNAERKKVGKSALVMDKAMMESAMLRAAECALYYSHTRPNGESSFTAINNYSAAGENIAAGYASAADAMEGWMNSPGHRSNILDEKNYKYQTIGIGVFKIDDTYYWCQLFNDMKKQSTPTQKTAVTKTVTVQARTGLLNLSINYTSLKLKNNETASLQVTNYNLGYGSSRHLLQSSGLTFTSADTHVATVSSSGQVKAVGGGDTTITVKSTNGVTLFTVPVTVESETVTAYITSTSTGNLKVAWNKVTGATTYRIYKSVYENGKWSSYQLFKSTKSLYCVDTSLKSGTRARYAVYAYAGSKKYDSHSTVLTTYLSQPSVKVTSASTGVKVSWGKVTGATTYQVYRSVYSGGKWSSYTYYKATKSTTYTDTKVKSGNRVRYTVYAVNGSYKSAYKTGVITTYLAQPTVKLAKATKGVKISWGKVTGATTYQVYKSVYKNGKWSSYTYYKATKSTTYTDTTVKAGTRVRYTVYAVNGSYKSAYKTGIIMKR